MFHSHLLHVPFLRSVVVYQYQTENASTVEESKALYRSQNGKICEHKLLHTRQILSLLLDLGYIGSKIPEFRPSLLAIPLYFTSRASIRPLAMDPLFDSSLSDDLTGYFVFPASMSTILFFFNSSFAAYLVQEADSSRRSSPNNRQGKGTSHDICPHPNGAYDIHPTMPILRGATGFGQRRAGVQ